MPKRSGRDIKTLALIFGPIFLLFILLLAFQYHDYLNDRTKIRHQLERRQDLETELAAIRLQGYVREITFVLERLSISLGSSKGFSEKNEGIGRAFDSLGGKVERLIYFDGDGNKVYSVLGNGTLLPLSENCRYEEFFTGPKMTMVPYISPVVRLEDKEEVIYFSYPVKDAGTGAFSGVVMAQAGRASFARLCDRLKETDPDIRFAYYGQQGDRICQEGCLQKGCPQARKELMSDKPTSVVAGTSGSGPGGSVRVVYYPVRIEGYRWYMTSEMPLSMVDRTLGWERFVYSGAGVFFILFLLAGGVYFRRVYMEKDAAEYQAAYQASVAEKNKSFETERDKLLAVLNGVPDGIILLDREGRVIDVNLSLREIASLPEEGPLKEIPEDSPLNAFLGPLDEAVEKTVGERTYRIIPAASQEGGGGVYREVRIVRDVSREKSLEQKRQDIVTTITHDIKNPLTAIIGMSEWLNNEKIKPCLGEDGTAAVEAINRSATRILALSENLLFLSSADGMHKLEKTPAEIGAFLGKVISEFYLEAKRRNVTLRNSIGDLPLLMQIDETQMQRAFSNLLNNSLRHTPEGGEITVTAKDFRGYVTVSISDTGPGISKEDLPHIFEKNYRASDGKKRIRDAGLGLSIAKAVIEAHGGTIDLFSGENYGATFVVRLPLVHLA